MSQVAIVLGTYNRLPLLQRAVESIRKAVDRYPYRIVVVDGGSTDGTREWLSQYENHHDITPIRQEGPLTGAVRAFNLGFSWATRMDFDYVMHMNDDAEIVTERAIDIAVDQLKEDPRIGEVAFAFDLWGYYNFDHINGAPYANFGVVRTQAGCDVAKAQGDPTGQHWWDPSFHTYAADTQFGIWLWKLGWRVVCNDKLQVHDLCARDELRAGNSGERRDLDAQLFWSRWRDEPLEARMKEVLANGR